MPLDKITRNSLRDFLSDVLAVRSAKTTVEVTFAVFSGIFNESIDRGYVRENPVSGLQKKVLPPKRKRTQSTPDPFTGEDLSVLLSVAWDKLTAPYPLILETMAMTDMRLSECITMKIENLGASNYQYIVSETMKNDRWGLPKSGKRLIDIPKSLVEKLAQHVKGLRRNALATGSKVDPLFPGVTQRLVQGALKRCCYAARLRVRHPHDLRHTYASILLSQNESIM